MQRIMHILHILEAIKKFEKRNEFIVEKYKELKYTQPEDAEMILEESEWNIDETFKQGF